MIRLALDDGVASIAIAFWRLALAAFVLAFIVLGQGSQRAEIRELPKQVWVLTVASGFFLALHFASWISSLAYTSVASSAALVTTNPIWIAIISWLIFKERIGGWLALGIATAMAGSLCIFLSDATATVVSGSNPMLGNTLALIGSLTVSGYLLLGRQLAGRISLWLYVWLVYASGALFLGLFAVVMQAELVGFSSLGWLCLVGLALGPQLLGHTGINYSLKHLTPALVAVAILGEPIGSAVLAWLVFDEKFAGLQLLGFAILLIGIFLATKTSVAPTEKSGNL
jgi:drug/metabolite transporter (DMT)-like permease